MPTPESRLAPNAAATKRAAAMDWEICHFCKRYKGRWFNGWRCSDWRSEHAARLSLTRGRQAYWRQLDGRGSDDEREDYR